jgi:hypothetical protein
MKIDTTDYVLFCDSLLRTIQELRDMFEKLENTEDANFEEMAKLAKKAEGGSKTLGALVFFVTQLELWKAQGLLEDK